MITETSVEVLRSRVSKGLTVCNDLWQKAKLPETSLEDFNRMDHQLDGLVVKLKELNDMLDYQGNGQCVFGKCKQADDFVCFVCFSR